MRFIKPLISPYEKKRIIHRGDKKIIVLHKPGDEENNHYSRHLVTLSSHYFERQERKGDLQTATVVTKSPICAIPQPMMTPAIR